MDPSIWGLPCEVVVICLYFLELKLVFSFTFFGEGDVTGQIFQFVSESKYLFNISKHFSDQMVGYWLLSWSRKQIKWNGSSTANVKSFFLKDFFFFYNIFLFFLLNIFAFLQKICLFFTKDFFYLCTGRQESATGIFLTRSSFNFIKKSFYTFQMSL